MAKVCIVLATYNGEKYLPQMLDSLCAQTRPADLIIAVDDGSSDSTVQTLQSYASKLPLQIKALPQNTGHRKAFACALELAAPQLGESDLVALADQDDIWLPRKLEILENALSESVPAHGGNTPSMAYGDAQIIDSNGATIAESWMKTERLLPHLPIKSQLTGFTNVTGCLMMFKASLFPMVLPLPEGVPVHDQWITLCASVQGGYTFIDEAVIQHRIHGGNAIGKAEGHAWTEKLKTNLQWAKAVRDSKLYAQLEAKEKEFLDRFITYLDTRFCKKFSLGYLPWLLKNSKAINPHVHRAVGHLARSLFGAIGIPVATRFLGKR